MRPIQAGDLVMVVKPLKCCGGVKSLGKVFRAKMVVTVVTRCKCCGNMGERTLAATKWGAGIEVSRLIRIDPPALPESVETDREVVA